MSAAATARAAKIPGSMPTATGTGTQATADGQVIAATGASTALPMVTATPAVASPISTATSLSTGTTISRVTPA